MDVSVQLPPAFLDELVDQVTARVLQRLAKSDPREFLTDDEAAAVAKVSPRTVRRWRRDGRLPYFLVGRIVRIRRSDLDELLTSE